MSAAAPLTDAPLEPTPLERRARALAESTRHLTRAPRFVSRVNGPRELSLPLERARARVAASASNETALPKAAEWFLDNYHLIRRVARQAEQELPKGFVRHLPVLADGPTQGRIRIEVLARALLFESELLLERSTLRRFLDAYQSVETLTIAELWALPTLLRAAALKHLLRFIDALHLEPTDAPARLPRGEAVELEPLSGVERSVRALRLLDAIDWKGLFESTNRVDAVLREDPTRLYAAMDFATCDAYRKAVERIAWEAGAPEHEVARAAVRLADAAPDEVRLRHVGHWLVGDGVESLEAAVGVKPRGLARLRRVVKRWPTVAYLLPLSLLTIAPLLAVAWALGGGWRFVAAALAAVPFSTAVMGWLHRGFAKLLPATRLPKLDFSKGIPQGLDTLVVVPALLSRERDVHALLRQLELHFLSNPDPRLQFALLTDTSDTTTAPDPLSPGPLVELATKGIDALNAAHGKNGRGPFHLLHRTPKWNEGEQRFMGWERKRGKLEELNRLLRGATDTTFERHVGQRSTLGRIKFVITLDADTQLPLGAAATLVGLLAHPLNQAVFDPRTGRVVSGYTVVQPRVDTAAPDGWPTPFSRLTAGNAGFDIYAHASSELYQDLFGAGIYVGKGIYDVDAFQKSTENRVPENALVSHDLFEGMHGRAALATDVVLYESYPDHAVAWLKRLHRWVRGDWQLVPWLFGRARAADGTRLPNRLPVIDRWKILDNLRRSVTPITTVVLLALGWWVPHVHVGWWTVGVLALHLSPHANELAFAKGQRLRVLGRWGLSLAFLAAEAALTLDAVVRVLVRRVFTKRHLLEWTTAAQAQAQAGQAARWGAWRTLFWSPVLAVGLGVATLVFEPASFLAAAPWLLAWLLAPELALRVSRAPNDEAQTLRPAERQSLRLLARRTWRFFETFVGPIDQWLPIDNHQESPREQTAHRTSPTNIGLSLVSTLTAWDFGFIGTSELVLRLRRAFESIARLDHHRGHLLNWYDTKSLAPLLPRYVSTVDSGNFQGCLVALEQGLHDVARAPVLRDEAWVGLLDSVQLLEEQLAQVAVGSTERLREVLGELRATAEAARADLTKSHRALVKLTDVTAANLGRELLAFVEAGSHRHEPDLLRGLRTTVQRLHQQLGLMRRDLEAVAPWLALEEEAVMVGVPLPEPGLPLERLPVAAVKLEHALDAAMARRIVTSPMVSTAAERLRAAISAGARAATAQLEALRTLAKAARTEAQGMDFGLLYDRDRELFHIGYNVTVDRLDANHYDLLASEARLASYLAVVNRVVPVKHWFTLGRPMTRVDGAPVLLSWGATMFEYLMPGLFMRSQPGTLLERTCALAVAAHRQHAKRLGQPWGISESSYARVDADHTYQYRSFGVPGLGFKRGIEEDQVVAPYASLLAAPIVPRAVLDNVRALERLGMSGEHGLYEALDFTPERALQHAPRGAPYAVVKSHMAHHQGMALIALGNLLNPRSMVDRFHADPTVRSGELLLNERSPVLAPEEWPIGDRAKVELPDEGALPHPPGPWEVDPAHGPQSFVLSNGRLSRTVAERGGGALVWEGVALTRDDADAGVAPGPWLWLRDDASGAVWRLGAGDGRTSYALHRVTRHERRHGLSVHVEVAVVASDDVEVRLVTLHNETGQARRVSVTSAARPALQDARRASSHPAFSSLFLESEPLAELDGLLFARRGQGKDEPPCVVVQRLVKPNRAAQFGGLETDRVAFFGRGATLECPLALARQSETLEGRTGVMLDPVMALRGNLELGPKAKVTVAFVTTVARSRAVAVDLARKYGTLHALEWAMRDAEHESARRMQRADVDGRVVPAVQRLFAALRSPPEALRATPEARRLAPPSQPRLWGRGISGDDPLVVVRVHQPTSPLVSELLGAQRFLRGCGVKFDLVLVDEQATGYVTEGTGTLRSVLQQHDAEDWVNRHGGIRVVPADQAPHGEVPHLEACARLLLSTRQGDLLAHFDALPKGAPSLPRFEPTRPVQASDPMPLPLLKEHNGIGGFSDDGREYVMHLPEGATTPAPWCNVLANETFGCLTSESGFGSSWAHNAGEHRLTPWRNDPVHDLPAEALYLRDEESAAVWSPTPLPLGGPGATVVRHGAGYTRWQREGHGLGQTLTVFVPPNRPLKVVRLELVNRTDRHRRLTATSVAEWVLGRRKDLEARHLVGEVVAESSAVLVEGSWAPEFAKGVAFLAAERPLHGFTFSREELFGRHGDWARPEALGRWGLSGHAVLGAEPVSALQVHLDVPPGATVVTHFLLGEAPTRAEALALVESLRPGEAVEAAWRELEAWWDRMLGAVTVATPEPSMNRFLNRWALYQTLAARLFGRTGLYQSSGAFGYRDQLQDVLALFHAAPELARAHLVEAAKHQFVEGDVLHWWHPPSGRGVRTRCSDDLVWLPYVTAEYVRATGDDSVLGELGSYLEGPPLRHDEHDRYAQHPVSAAQGSLYEHCRRALDRANTAGEHGLPLMGDGDWNDGMNRIGALGRGESVWLAWFLCATELKFAVVAEGTGDQAYADTLRARARARREAVERTAWDGGWYVRAFHDDGSKVGSAQSHACRIDSIAQSWAALSSEGPPNERARTAVRAADLELVREAERLVLLFWPPYEGDRHDPGYIANYPQGVRENGGQYTHAATWLGWAHATLGDGAAAERIFRLLNPALRARTPDEVATYRIEPYVLAGDVYGQAPWVGRGGWSWYTGSASWTWRLGVEAVLGLTREGGALRIAPAIPPSWPGFEATVRRGKATVHVVVANPEHVGSGVVTLVVDGVPVVGDRVSIDETVERTIEVRARIGSRKA